MEAVKVHTEGVSARANAEIEKIKQARFDAGRGLGITKTFLQALSASAKTFIPGILSDLFPQSVRIKAWLARAEEAESIASLKSLGAIAGTKKGTFRDRWATGWLKD